MGADEPVDMIGLNRHLDHRRSPSITVDHRRSPSITVDHRPLMLRRHLTDDLPQASAYRPNQRLAPPFRTPDDVVPNEVDAVRLMFIVPVHRPCSSSLVIDGYEPPSRASQMGHSSPLKSRGFLAPFL
jgi:hypothetical protein